MGSALRSSAYAPNSIARSEFRIARRRALGPTPTYDCNHPVWTDRTDVTPQSR
ncbi:hypothetical protein BAUCODRAFT_123301 [Baudoinia panamericana UAMH 10762]|uniref:Uncharacterized protein n=1 Tax=Baudoinia panamericana (strain UAMH 10762) TaxID=717646 RepID=M2MHF7_BAUPA|nr:uncharacterized protein BAUCODRAFT_123301 [Baudoinia panamericana UAMH 10762]EMC96026.1 hypothetical protein BAUCODRAFT_123301 [Baudoinia panamericana UAMH 10762]